MKKKLNHTPLAGYKETAIDDIRHIAKTSKFSANDIILIEARMRKSGYTHFSAFVRDCALQTEIVERITSEQMEILRELLRERNNINQIAKACNAGKCWSVANMATKVLGKLDAIIDRFNRT